MFKRLLLASSAAIALSVAFAPSALAAISQPYPLAGLTYVDSVPVSWTISTQASSLSMVWTYTSGPYASTEAGHQITINLANPGSTTHGSFTFSPASPTSSPSIASVSGGPFYDGTYSEAMSYVQASNGITFATTTKTNIGVDFETAPPSLTVPVNSSTGNTLPVAFDLPQPPAPAAGTVQLSLTNQSTNAVTTLDLPSTQNQSFTLSPSNLGGGSSATVASGPSSLADGTYSVVLSYANQYNDAAASSAPLTWTLDTTTQTPQAPSVSGGTDGSALQIGYDLPEAATPGTVQLIFTGLTTVIVSLTDQTTGNHTLTLDPSDLSTSSDVASTVPANATLPSGSYTVTVAYQDALGNPATTSAISNLTISPVAPSTTTTTSPTTSTAPTPTVTTTTSPTTSTAPTPTVTTTTSPVPTTTTTPTTPTTAAEPGGACPPPAGRMSGSRLGPLALGMSPASARAIMPQYVVTRAGLDRFCLSGGHAARVVYASPRLLAWVPPVQRGSIRERIVLAMTSDPLYSLDSIAPGATLAAASSALHLSAPLQIGLNTWYFVPGASVYGVLKVSDGVVDEIGIASQWIAAAGVRARTMRSLWTTMSS